MKRYGGMVLATVLAVLGSTWAPAQERVPDLDDLQRQVDAERARQERAAAAQRQTAAAAARQGTLVIRADADCALTVNGESKGQLQAEQTTTVKVNPGGQLIECDAGEGRRAETTEQIPTGEQKVVRLTVPPPARFQVVSDGLLDKDQNLVWTASDNGSDIDWHGAQRHCGGKGGDWSLPTAAQLQSLYGSDAGGMSCGGHGTCKVSPQFRLSGTWFWSSELNGSSEAWHVFLTNNIRLADRVSVSYNGRALCVRRRS